ncbi:hypothetical protein AWRI3579_g3245 [Hanseniaspora osmophila]|uniref:Uncharacterized protein n=1 Tax=Hanseniaspora osmophila TaxID=56408 RepID=A0A1E5R7U4_9ASCO|nr:hypothetical protein AWRI3579_g3245 [Hanseniaspora osmophila]
MSCALPNDFLLPNYTELDLINKLQGLSRESILDLIKEWDKNAKSSTILESAEKIDKKYANRDSTFINVLVKTVLAAGLTAGQRADLERTLVLSNIGEIDEWSAYKIFDKKWDLPTAKYVSTNKLKTTLDKELIKRSKAFHISEQGIADARLKMLSVLIFDNYLEAELEKLSSGENFDELFKSCLITSLSKSSQLSAKQIILDGRSSNFTFSELYESELHDTHVAYDTILEPYIKHSVDIPLTTTDSQEGLRYSHLSYFFKQAPAKSEA